MLNTLYIIYINILNIVYIMFDNMVYNTVLTVSIVYRLTNDYTYSVYVHITHILRTLYVHCNLFTFTLITLLSVITFVYYYNMFTDYFTQEYIVNNIGILYPELDYFDHYDDSLHNK